jgi:hypothetical protein
LTTRQEVATLVAPGYSFGQIEFSPDGAVVLALNIEGSLFLWRVPSPDVIAAHDSSLWP